MKAPLEISPQLSKRRESFISERLTAFAMTKKLENKELKKYSVGPHDFSPDITLMNFERIKSLLSKNEIFINESPLRYLIAKYFLNLEKNEILDGFSISEATLTSWKSRLDSRLSKMSYPQKQKLLDILLYSEYLSIND